MTLVSTTRVGHWRRNRCDVYIGRGSPWGNPYVFPGMARRSRYPVTEVEDPLAAYEAHIRADAAAMAALPTLRGKVLGCFCVDVDAPLPTKREDERCHGHVLVRLLGEVAERSP